MKQSLSNHELEQTWFIPPFCPDEICSYHSPSENWRYKLKGWYRRKSTGLRYRRYKCLHCNRSFSTSTFQIGYWLHKPELIPLIASMAVICGCLRQIGRELNVSHTTVGRYLSRIGRQCLLHHQSTLKGFTITESIAVDGFETFEYSQYFPVHFHLATGRESWFIYHFTDSPLRRKGRMTEEQKKRRLELEKQFGRPDPKAIEKDMAELIGTIVAKMHRQQVVEIHSDEHQAYPRAIRRLRRERPALPEVTLKTISSKAARTMRNPLFSINRADLLIRHCSANHKRETIAFSKLRQRAAERLAVLVVYLNEIKRQREKGPPKSSAMILGLRKRLLTWNDVLLTRMFPSHLNLVGRWKEYYWGQVKTAIFGTRQTPHQLRYAL
jgi:transposase-like protein